MTIITVQFTLVFSLIALTADGCRTSTSILDYILYDHTYDVIANISLVKCISACDMEFNCYSINYLFTMTICVLNNATRAVEPIKFQYRPDVVYIEHLDRPQGSCDGDFPCENRGTCVNIPQYPGYRCFCRDAYVGEQCEGMYMVQLAFCMWRNFTTNTRKPYAFSLLFPFLILLR